MTATCCAALIFSLSNRWNVARLTSAISSSSRTERCWDQLLSVCGKSAEGIVDADALPASENPSPAAPSAVTAAALFVWLPFAACCVRRMVASFRCWVQADLASLSGRCNRTVLRMPGGASGSYLRELFSNNTA